MSFVTVKDQAVAVRLLRSITAKGRIPAGLMLWGPSGVGKRMAAMELAKALNCAAGGGDACDRCLSCRKAASGNHPDIIVVSPAGRTRIIKVDAVERMNETTVYRPFEGGRRIFIIEDADRMNEAAQNHFLKTLEEPASATVFVLVTANPRQLLPTIRSRCQPVRFGALRRETVAELLSARCGLSPEAALPIAALSQGQMGRALDLHESGRRDMVLSVIHRLSSGGDPLLLGEEFAAYLQTVERGVAEAVKRPAAGAGNGGGDIEDEEGDESGEGNGGDLEKEQLEALIAGRMRLEMYEHIHLFQSWYRDELVCRAPGGAKHALNRDHLARLTAAKGGDPAAKLEALDRAWLYLERNINRGRVFRDLFFALAV